MLAINTCKKSSSSLNLTKTGEEGKTFRMNPTYHSTTSLQMTLRLHLRVTEWLT